MGQADCKSYAIWFDNGDNEIFGSESLAKLLRRLERDNPSPVIAAISLSSLIRPVAGGPAFMFAAVNNTKGPKT